VLGAARSCVTATDSIDYRRPDATIASVSKCATGRFGGQ
jgi:hypothetical protein